MGNQLSSDCYTCRSVISVGCSADVTATPRTRNSNTAAGNFDGSFVQLKAYTNSALGQWEQTATFSSGGGQSAFIYKLRARVETGSPLCLTATSTVDVVVAAGNNTDSQKWFHPTAVSGPGGSLPTKNVGQAHCLSHRGDQAQGPASRKPPTLCLPRSGA